MTGQDFGKIFDDKWDKAYSQYLDSDKKNRLIREAMYRLVSSVYSDADTQKEADELAFGLIKNEKVIPVGNRITTENFVNEYMHLLRMAFVFKTSISYTVVDGVLTSAGHTLRKGDIVIRTRSSVGVEHEVSKVRGSSFYLSGYTYQVGDTLQLKQTIEATPLESDRKRSPATAGETENPKYEIAYTAAGINPRSYNLYPTPSYVLVDYLAAPPVDIDVDDTVDNLEDYFTPKFLYRLADECVRLGGERTRDGAGMQIATKAIIDNP